MKKIFGMIFVVGLLLALSSSVLPILTQEGESDEHKHTDRPETELQSPIPLNPAAGSEIGLVFEAFLSPQQEGGEEEENADDADRFVPQFTTQKIEGQSDTLRFIGAKSDAVAAAFAMRGQVDQ